MQGLTGATAGCREASDGSCAAKADGGVNVTSVAGTGEGEGDEGSSPGSDEVITATSVAGGVMGSRDADTNELVAGLLVYTMRLTASIMRWAATTKSKPTTNGVENLTHKIYALVYA